MNNHCIKTLIKLWLFFPVHAFSASAPTGFGVADWGMERNEIIASEGSPDSVGRTDGNLMYYEKEVMGKKAGVIYYFEHGCSALKTSKCIFSDGIYGFNDGSKQFSDKIEKTLTKKYGPPNSVEKNIVINTIPGYVTKGKRETEVTTYTRFVGQIKIVHSNEYNLYDYTDISGAVNKAGPVCNDIHYYGPYYNKINKNKKKADQRGL